MTKKTEFRFFSVMQWEKEQEYLQNCHKLGWKFTRVTFPGFYHFEKCEPEDVIYQLDYNQRGLQNKNEYIQMFRDCGWEYILDFVGYSYFRKAVSEMKELEEIFCDEESRLEMIRRVFRGRIIPLIIIFGGVVVPQMITQFYSDHRSGQGFFIVFTILFLVYLGIFVESGVQYCRLKNRSEK